MSVEVILAYTEVVEAVRKNTQKWLLALLLIVPHMRIVDKRTS